MKRLVCILIVLCSAVTACNGNDPLPGKRGRERTAEVRLTNAEWKPCCRRARINRTCDDPIKDADEARELLFDAHGKCLDHVMETVQRLAKEDLAPAYFLRARRNGDPLDYLEAWKAADPKTAEGRFNRALTLEFLGLTQPAIAAWNEVQAKDGSEWRKEARNRAEALMNAPKPVARPESPVDPRLKDAGARYYRGEKVLSLVNALHLSDYRLHTFRAVVLEDLGSYAEALTAYDDALALANGDPTAVANIRERLSLNRTVTGNPEQGFREAFQAISRLPRVTDLNTRHQAYASAARAAWDLPGCRDIALMYQNAAVIELQKAPPSPRSKQHLSIALRARANMLIQLHLDDDAVEDLNTAADLVDAVGKDTAALLRMRINEVRGEAALNRNPGEARARFTDAIDAARQENPTYRAVLFFKRFIARQKLRDPQAEEDLAEALKILREEAGALVDPKKRGEHEELWTPYFSRFRDMYVAMIEGRIAANDIEGAFVYAEQMRAFEPMDLLLQSSAPEGFRKIETVVDLRRHQAELPDDTAILQFLVLGDKTYTWVLTRDRLALSLQRVSAADIERWLADVNQAVLTQQRPPFTRAMRAAYGELFRAPLLRAGLERTRIVIVPDTPMHGLPFAGLQGTEREGYLLDSRNIAVAGSASLYFYALRRNQELRAQGKPEILVVGNPDAGKRLPYAEQEAEQIADDYGNTKPLLGEDATPSRFLKAMKTAGIVHFAGHSFANPVEPWHSSLWLTPEADRPGELTAQELIKELPVLEHTRLVVLAACTSGGGRVGPEGIAPLIRPIITAKVPAVVGSLWEVNDATAKNLMVSLHCHYRNGDDVAVALQHAQREVLRTQSPLVWAPFQVVGYAETPYARPTAMETNHNELCSQNSVHGPHGLSSQ